MAGLQESPGVLPATATQPPPAPNPVSAEKIVVAASAEPVKNNTRPSRTIWKAGKFFCRLLNGGLSACSLDDLKKLCTVAGYFLKKEVLPGVPLPCCVVGDLNGDIFALKAIKSLYNERKSRVVFLGNYIGKHNETSLECLCLLLAMKINNRRNFTILRGPNETQEAAMDFGLHNQLVQRYGAQDGAAIFTKLVSVFNLLPTAAIAGDKVFCAHGGVSRWHPSREDFATIQRPVELKDDALVADLVSSEPWNGLDSIGRHPEKDVLVFGEIHVEATIQRLNCKMIIRGATDCLNEDGCDVFAKGQMILISSTFQGALGAVVHIEEDGWKVRFMEKAGEGKVRLLESDLYKIGAGINDSYHVKI